MTANTVQFSSGFGIFYSRESSPPILGLGPAVSTEPWCSAPEGSGQEGAEQSAGGATGNGMTDEEAREFLRSQQVLLSRARRAGSGSVGGL